MSTQALLHTDAYLNMCSCHLVLCHCKADVCLMHKLAVNLAGLATHMQTHKLNINSVTQS